MAYPFSAGPTPHLVAIAGGPRVHSKCAIDSLGIPPMLGTDAVITSADPLTGAPVTVTFSGGQASWDPPGAVVFATRSSACCPPMASQPRRSPTLSAIRARAPPSASTAMS